jgi:hypothetical protein
MVDALLAHPGTRDVPNKNGLRAWDLAPPSAAGDSIRHAIDHWSRGHLERFDALLAAATPTTLIASMRDAVIPDRLSTAQKDRIKALCAQFHPEVLTSPLIDVNGHPIAVEVPTVRLTDPAIFGRNVEKPESIKRAVKAIFTDYPAHLGWLRENTAIRKITAEDVPSHGHKLVGQEGWFAARTIPMGTPVALLNGMILEDPRDIETDKKLRKLAGCDHYFVRRAPEGKILQAMGHSMKCNAVSGLADVLRLNLTTLAVDVTRISTQERFKILIYFARLDIEADEQLLAFYSPRQSR